MYITADCHVHSNTSPDASDTIDAMCQTAIDKGLKHICFTNHHEIFPGTPTPSDFLLDFDAYDQEIEAARDKYSDKIDILKGVEFGSPHRHPREYEELLTKDLDMIIASLHFLPLDYGIHYLWCNQEEFADYFLQCYYEEMEKLTEVRGFQVLAHMDWPKIGLPNFYKVKKINPAIFKNLIKNGAVPEINTSALNKGCKDFHPAPPLLNQYQEAGGKNLTVGSDAHCCRDIATHFEKAADFADYYNFKIGYFKKKKFIALND